MRLQEERDGRGQRVPPGSPPQRTSLWSQPPPRPLKAEFTRMSGGLPGREHGVALGDVSAAQVSRHHLIPGVSPEKGLWVRQSGGGGTGLVWENLIPSPPEVCVWGVTGEGSFQVPTA